MIRRPLATPIIVLSLAASLYAQTSDPPAADPARPTVTNPAHIPPPGYLQFEQGALVVTGTESFERQLTLQQCAKLSLGHYFMVQEQWQPASFTSLPATSQTDSGSIILGAQVLLTDIKEGHGRVPTIALGYLETVREGNAPDFDAGSAKRSLSLLGSGQAAGFHYDANLIANEVTDGQVRRGQTGEAVAISHNVTRSLSLSGELWTFTQPLSHGRTAGNLWAAGYTVRPSLVLDGGFSRGLTSTSAHWYGFAGFTYLLPHALWRQSK